MSNITQGKIVNLLQSTVLIFEIILNDYETNKITMKWFKSFIVNIKPINPDFKTGYFFE